MYRALRSEVLTPSFVLPDLRCNATVPTNLCCEMQPCQRAVTRNACDSRRPGVPALRVPHLCGWMDASHRRCQPFETYARVAASSRSGSVRRLVPLHARARVCVCVAGLIAFVDVATKPRIFNFTKKKRQDGSWFQGRSRRVHQPAALCGVTLHLATTIRSLGLHTRATISLLM